MSQHFSAFDESTLVAEPVPPGLAISGKHNRNYFFNERFDEPSVLLILSAVFAPSSLAVFVSLSVISAGKCKANVSQISDISV